MRTVSTKLDRKEHERLLEMCNDEGKSVAEELREMVQMSCDVWDEGKEIEKEEKAKQIAKGTVISLDNKPAEFQNPR